MRLRRLSLDRFGHFTDRHFDFGAVGERPDFHIIHGANESGKTTTMETTTMEAVLRLFYGFPHREGYAFKHQRKNLQVSGVLEIDGDPRGFTRLPGRSGTLVDEAGAAVPETALAAHLAGLSQEDYRKLLCLDDDTIERGGEEIAQARGDIGRLLFSAAAGVSDLSTVLEGVREEADAIWRRRASKTRMAELKRDLTQVEKDIRERDMSANAWRGIKKALAGAQDVETEARKVRDELHGKSAQVASRRRALPLLGEIDALAERIAPFATWPERLDFDPEYLVGLIAGERQAKADIERLTGEIEAWTTTLEGLDRNPERVALTGELDALDDLRARDVAAGLDLERRRDLVRETEAAMAAAARDLRTRDGTDPRSLVLSPADIAGLEQAGEALRTAQAAAAQEAREVAALVERHDRAREAHDRAVSQGPVEIGIGDILTGHDADRLAPVVAMARQAIDDAQEAERRAREALTVGAVRFETLPDCPTGRIRAQEWFDSHCGLVRKIGQTEDALAHHVEDITARRAQAGQLTASGGLVADNEAQALKGERDRLWQAHRSALSEETADPFETAMHALDAAMLSRVTHASDLGQLRQVEQACAETQARADETETRLKALRAEQAILQAEVDEAAGSVGLPVPQSPQEWLDWVCRHGEAADATQRLATLRNDHQPVLDRAQRLVEELHPHVNLQSPDFDSALAAARRLAEAERQTTVAVDTTREALGAAENDLARRREKQAAARQQAQEAETAWRSLVCETLGDAVEPETLLASLDPLRQLRTHEERRADVAQRVATMEEDRAQFLAETTALATAHDLPVADTAAATFDMLRERSEAARETEARAADLTGKIEQAGKALEQTQGQLDGIGREVEAMGRIFEPPVETLDALRSAATQAQQVIAERSERTKKERAMLSELSAGDMTQVRVMLDGATTAGLEAETNTVEADLEAADQRLMEATEARLAAGQDLSRVTADVDIAVLTERKATLELQLEEAALEHLELSLGHGLAEEAIRRYRDTHRSGMMAATERAFAALTRDAYPRLATRPDGTDETLLAFDGHGAAKRVAEMSKGTRFQLYLALRAAAHAQMVEQGVCLPFFCDDIFETFDEDRTSAACQIMEQIGHNGQAIYLTHHRHVVDIARQVCKTEPVVHEI